MNKLNVMTLMLLSMAISTTLTGCGGGGGSEQPQQAPGAPLASSPVTPAPSTSTTSQSQDETDKTDIQQLKIDANNSLSLTQTMNVSVQTNAESAYLSICLTQDEEVSVGEISYSECIIRTSLKYEHEEISFNIANHVDNLVAVIWYFNNDKEPFVSRWQRKNATVYEDSLSWSIEDSE